MNILYVEDDARDADLTRREFARSAPHFQLDTVATQREALAHLEGEPGYDLVLTDLRLPDGDGLALLAHVRERGLGLAVVVITGGGDEESAVAALKAGADDYVVKGEGYLARLPLALENALHRFRAEADRRAHLLRVLYAEHHASDIDLTRRHLARHAPYIHVDVVHNAPGIFQRLSERDRYHLLLLDYQLPGMNGLEVLKELDQVRELDLPVVLVTGRGSEEMAVQALRLGAADYLVKNPGYLYRLPSVLEDAYHRAQLAREQAALRLERDNLVNILDAMEDGVYIVDQQYDIQYVNPVLVNDFGPYEGRKCYAYFHDREEVCPWCKNQDVFAGKTVRWEWYSFKNQRTYDLIDTPLRNADGSLSKLEIFHDITERVRAQEALRRSEERYRAVVEYQTDLICRFLPDSTLTFVNQAYCRYHGKQREELVGHSFMPHILPEDRERVAQHLASFSQEMPVATIEHRAVAAGGQVRWQQWINRPIFDEQGDLIEFQSVGRDITERRRAEEERKRLLAQVREQAQRVQQIIDTVPEGVLLLDPNGRVILANPLGKKNLAALADAQVGDTLTRLGDRSLVELLTSPPKGLWHEVTIPGSAGDRPERSFEVIARPLDIELESKEPALSPSASLGINSAEDWVLVIRDVTQEREVQRRVQQQERLAAVGQLAGGIAHDFNNLLTTIILYAQLPLGEHDLTPDLTRAFETIIGESRKAAKLVQQILDFSRRSPIETHPVDLKPFVEEAVRVLERTIPESISLLLEVEPEECVVNADPTRVQQVLMNLVVNARDAMPEGGVLRIDLSRVEVGPGEEPPVAEMVPGEWVCLAVSDTGTGIPPEALAHIFEPFFTTKEPGRGTGLGLAQVDGIVAQHEGHIGVETELGQGTTFRVYLPAHGVEALEKVGAEAASALPQGKGETILLVEDHERIREVARQLLEPLGYRVLTAANGREALEVYRAARSGDRPQQGVDLVITDVVMPEMGGKRLVRELRKTITGYIVEENVQELRKEGFLDVVYKPFDMDRLAHVVRRVLDED